MNTVKKTVLITGASSGIGLVTAQHMARAGWQVYATMRKPSPDHVLAQEPNVTLLPLDVTLLETIYTAVHTVVAQTGKLDVVVNNAGYGAVGAFELATDEQIRKQYETNVFGIFNVVKAVLPQMRKQKGGIIINVASMGGRLTFPLYSLYHGTKWAVEGFSEALNFELRQFGIKVRIIEPGPIKTDFYDRSMDLFHDPGNQAYENYTQLVMPQMQAAGANAPGPEVVAKAILKAATDGGSRIRYAVGGNAPALLLLRRLLPDAWFMGIVRAVIERK